ncbi:amidohydrolase [Caloranaerobacter azorensis]|uniref:Amidohydrolase n=1 Tax=Caloranaerobacter azorensis TaxID=116090 RepID=A0A6P1YCA6_9FIRM|nr:amidohydrolase [Caloranaerobacter azorensis]QIB26353.1 amidohydrolase [Caloranaerobacter azorensis]
MSKLFFFNGKILTMEDSQKEVECIVTENNKIIFCGSYEEGKKFIDKNTKYIDLEGRTLLPGFNDSHMHLISYGLSKYKVDLSNADSILHMQKALKEFVNNEKVRIFKEWILGHGWNQENFIEGRLPNKYDIDRVINDRPVFLSRACYHICVVNSMALKLAGITKETRDPEGGKIDRDPVTGEPTGILRENAVYLVYNLIPFTEDIGEIKEIIQSAIDDANKVGITSIQTDDFSHLKSYKKILYAYQELKNEKKLNARINLQMLLDTKDKLIDFLKMNKKTGDGDEMVKFGPLKLLADGSLGSKTAALEAPYSDDINTKGVLIYTTEEIEKILTLAHVNGLQLAVHTIGDRAMKQVLSIYYRLNKMYYRKDARFRLIHCQILSRDIIEQFKKLNVIADIQPIFIKTDMQIAESRVGKERLKYSYAWNTMHNEGIFLSGGSDAPVEPFNPLYGIYCAVTRKDLNGYPEKGWYPEEKLDLYTALKLFTINPAYCTFEENIKGSIKTGKLADLVVLSEDITKIPLDKIKDVKVDMTVLSGKVIFSRN